MMPIFLNSLPVLTFTVLIGVYAGPAAAGGGVIAGTVTDPSTGLSVHGAEISLPLGLATLTAMTDSTGVFFLRDVPEGSGFTLTIAREGRRTARLTLNVSSGDTSRVRAELPSAYITLLAPSEPVHFVAGTDVSIRWESGGIDAVRIEFSADGGSRWLILAGRIEASAGMWRWPVPDIPAVNGVIRITAPGWNGIEARSAAVSITST